MRTTKRIMTLALILGLAALPLIAQIPPTEADLKTQVKIEEALPVDKTAQSGTEEKATPKTEPLSALGDRVATLEEPAVLTIRPDALRPNPAKVAAVFPKQSDPDSGWQFAFAPYLFAAGISGTVGARGRTLEVDANFGSVWESLDIGLMGAFEARKGRFVSFNDFFWTKLSAEQDTPGPFYSTAKLGVNLFIFDPEIGYRLIESERGSLDVLGGVRIWSVETNLNTTTGVLPGFDVSQRKTWGAPVVGVHGVANVTPKFFLAGKFDIGGAGIGADLTTQLYGGAGYRVHKNVALLGGYRWLQVDYDDDSGFIFDTQMHGLLFGARFSF